MPDARDGVGVREDAARSRAIRRGIDCRGNCYEGSGCPTTSSQVSAWENDAARPRVSGVKVGGELRDVKRSAHDVAADRRMGERRSSTQIGYRPWGKLRDVKRPACFQRQTGACRSCGLAVSQPCRGREEPVGATDLSATGRRTPTDQVRTRRRERSVPESYGESDRLPTGRLVPNGRSDQPQPQDRCPATEAINPSRRTGVQRRKRSTPIAERVSNGRRA